MANDRWSGLFRALRSRNFKLFVAGQGVSLIGTWMQQVAMSWLIYRLTGSALMLGILGFTSQIPTFLIAPAAGVLADRAYRRRLLIVTQTLSMIQALVIAGAVFFEAIEVWHLIALSIFLGLVNGFDIPIRQSFVVEMVEGKEDLGNAIALNSSMVHAARLVGPAVAGLLVASVGEGTCFALNAASYLGVIFALAAMRLTPRTGDGRPRKHPLHELKEGFDYAYGFGPIKSLLMVIALVSFAGMPYAVLIPIFAKEVLGGGAHTFGFLVAASGIGSLAATVFLASRKSVLGLGRIMTWGLFLVSAGITIFALSNHMVLSLAALVVTGWGVMSVIAAGNTILQTILEEDKRGRVMSFFTMAFMGMAPFGSLGAGAMAGAIGPRDTLLLGGVGCLAGAALFARQLPHIREKVRPIYVRMGIIREVANGMETAAEQPPLRENL